MDAKERALRRCVSILRGGLEPTLYDGITTILVSTRLRDEVVQAAADAIAGDPASPPSTKPYIRFGKGK